jgi:hypothetical protein
MRFSERSLTVLIDLSQCRECASKACVAACGLYDRGVLQLSDGLPSVDHLEESELLRRATECLACEFACRLYGLGALSIHVPIEGFDALEHGPSTQDSGEQV